ncbi:hypothetical protein GCM10009733_055160 [Nonomuraea maheshkhaliensis]|uniref:Uncharacterized protein n=1 Tax=Nonomuraea maheshkhaliensis TaxID=419590 RepID=A0ABP4RFY0_9ACTN
MSELDELPIAATAMTSSTKTAASEPKIAPSTPATPIPDFFCGGRCHCCGGMGGGIGGGVGGGGGGYPGPGPYCGGPYCRPCGGPCGGP